MDILRYNIPGLYLNTAHHTYKDRILHGNPR